MKFPYLGGLGMWSPIIGCSECSQACKHCAERTRGSKFVRPLLEKYRSQVIAEDGSWNGQIVFIPELLKVPFRLGPRVLNAGVASDMFHENVTDEWRAKMFGAMGRLSRHHFVIPTRRADSMVTWFANDRSDAIAQAKTWDNYEGAMDMLPWPFSNMTLSVSVENQARANDQVPQLVKIKGVRKLVECSPLMGSIDLSIWADRIDWISISALYSDGKDYINNPQWVYDIEELCRERSIPLFFRGWGNTGGNNKTDLPGTSFIRGTLYREWPGF